MKNMENIASSIFTERSSRGTQRRPAENRFRHFNCTFNYRKSASYNEVIAVTEKKEKNPEMHSRMRVRGRTENETRPSFA